jgi:hypothetical protein
MRVKRTKKGNFSFDLTRIDRQNIFSALFAFLEDESTMVRSLPMMKEADVMRHLYYSILNQVFRRLDFQLHSNENSKWSMTRAESLAIMWLLRDYDDSIAMLEMKCSLHKQLYAIS